MATDLTVINEQNARTAGEIRAHVNRVQEVMKAVMQKDTHYGVIPGSKKPSLYKPGAEVLCVTFRVAQSYKTEDLSTADSVRYRIACVGTHQLTGVVLGEGIGECSSNEEKYKWRRAICAEEFEDTPPDRRRVKYSKYQGKVEKTQQVRTEPADIANTVLKMAAKRAQVAMTLNVTAASDCFTQDIEDLPEELVELERSREQAAQQYQVPSGPPLYPQDAFERVLAKWRENGTKTPDEFIALLQTKGVLSAEQIAEIKKPKPVQGEVMTEEEIAAAKERELAEATRI
jgi:hypothetical protein